MRKLIKLTSNILRFNKNNVDQVFAVLLFLVAFFDFSLLSPFINKVHLGTLFKISILFINLYFAVVSFLFFQNLRTQKFKLPPVVIPVLIFVLIRLFFLDYIPRWDSSEYFAALLRTFHEYDYSFYYFIKSFNWFGHLTMGFSFVTSVLQFLSPANLLVLQISNLILGCIAVYSFHSICRYFFKDKFENLLATVLFSVNPLFIATSIIYVPDFGVLVFTLATVATYLHRKLVLFLFFSLILIFTKETGALIYFVFAFAQIFIVEFYRWKVKHKLDLFKVVVMIFPLVLLFLYFVYIKWSFWAPDGKNFLTLTGECRFCFGIKPFNIYQNLMVFFILNFNWILSSIVIAALFIRRGNFGGTKGRDMLTLVSILSVFVMFFLVFIIYIMPRYVAPVIGIFILIFYFCLKHLIYSNKNRRLILYALIFLFSLQTFVTVDPVSKFLFGTYRIGNREILRIGTEYLADGMVYNTEFMYTQRLIGEFITDFKIASDDNIFIDPYAWGNFRTGWGFFEKVQPNVYYSLEDVNALPRDLYYLTFPFMKYGGKEQNKIQLGFVPPLIDDGHVLDRLKTVYKVTESLKIDKNGYSVDVYKLSKLDEK